MGITYFCITLLFAFPVLLSGAEPEKRDSTNNARYKFGVIPSLAYDSDLGFKYGAVLNFFDYGQAVSLHQTNQYNQGKFEFTNGT